LHPLGVEQHPSATEHVGLEHVVVARHEPLALSHTTSQAHEALHDTPPPHAPAAQRVSHAPDPQSTPPAHALSPHCTAQLPAAEQSTPPPQEADPHVTAHAPGPHVTRCGQALSPHSMEHALESLQSIGRVQPAEPQRT
jgi:hypothetical protein